MIDIHSRHFVASADDMHKTIKKQIMRTNQSITQERERDCLDYIIVRGGGLGSRPKKLYGERLGDGVEYHLMKPTPRR